MATDVAQTNVTVGNRLPQFTRDVEPRQRAQSQGVREEADLRGSAALRLDGRGARVIQQHLGRGRILAEDGHARIGRQLEIGVADADGLAQARAYGRDTGVDRIAIRSVEDQRQQAVAELPQEPRRLLAIEVGLCRQPEHGSTDEQLGYFGIEALGDIAHAIHMNDGYRCGLFAQRGQ
jgi:hypothetical protein